MIFECITRWNDACEMRIQHVHDVIDKMREEKCEDVTRWREVQETTVELLSTHIIRVASLPQQTRLLTAILDIWSTCEFPLQPLEGVLVEEMSSLGDALAIIAFPHKAAEIATPTTANAITTSSPSTSTTPPVPCPLRFSSRVYLSLVSHRLSSSPHHRRESDAWFGRSASIRRLVTEILGNMHRPVQQPPYVLITNIHKSVRDGKLKSGKSGTAQEMVREKSC